MRLITTTASVTISSLVAKPRRKVTIYTTMLRNGNLFYLIGVTPQDQSGVYSRTFRTMLQSLEINA